MANAVYNEAVEYEVSEVVRGEFGETVAQMIDRGMSLYERYGDDAERDFYLAVTDAWRERHPGDVRLAPVRREGHVMPLPIATRLVIQALREEGLAWRESSNPDRDDDPRALIGVALEAVADRVERSGSSVRPQAATPASDAPMVSASDLILLPGDKSHPGPEVIVTHPGAVRATLVELKRQLHAEGVGDRMSGRSKHLLDDALILSDRPPQKLGLVGAMLLDFWSQLEDSPYNLPISMRQLLWDAIVETGDRPLGERPERRR